MAADQTAGERSIPAAHRAYQALERCLVTLELAPGSVTTEGELITRVSMGRTPVREAIHRLAWEGLIEIRPRAGLVIAPLHAGDWLRVLDARRGVEAVLASCAARYVTHASAIRFHHAALAMQEAVRRNDPVAFLDADKALDDAMAAAADNPFAARAAAPLQAHSRRFWFRYRHPSGLAAAAARHVDIVHAVVEGDAATAALSAERLIAQLRLHAEEAVRR